MSTNVPLKGGIVIKQEKTGDMAYEMINSPELKAKNLNARTTESVLFYDLMTRAKSKVWEE